MKNQYFIEIIKKNTKKKIFQEYYYENINNILEDYNNTKYIQNILINDIYSYDEKVNNKPELKDYYLYETKLSKNSSKEEIELSNTSELNFSFNYLISDKQNVDYTKIINYYNKHFLKNYKFKFFFSLFRLSGIKKIESMLENSLIFSNIKLTDFEFKQILLNKDLFSKIINNNYLLNNIISNNEKIISKCLKEYINLSNNLLNVQNENLINYNENLNQFSPREIIKFFNDNNMLNFFQKVETRYYQKFCLSDFLSFYKNINDKFPKTIKSLGDTNFVSNDLEILNHNIKQTEKTFSEKRINFSIINIIDEIKNYCKQIDIKNYSKESQTYIENILNKEMPDIEQLIKKIKFKDSNEEQIILKGTENSLKNILKNIQNIEEEYQEKLKSSLLIKNKTINHK